MIKKFLCFVLHTSAYIFRTVALPVMTDAFSVVGFIAATA
jgi:hypothetical protein